MGGEDNQVFIEIVRKLADEGGSTRAYTCTACLKDVRELFHGEKLAFCFQRDSACSWIVLVRFFEELEKLPTPHIPLVIIDMRRLGDKPRALLQLSNGIDDSEILRLKEGAVEGRVRGYPYKEEIRSFLKTIIGESESA